MDRPGLSQVQTCMPDGTDVRWLGSIGSVTGLKYSYVLPGGDSAMSCLLQTEPNSRQSALNPGRTVRIYRGSCIWTGKLTEPQPGANGWAISATGRGTLGANYVSKYTTWNADDPINQAIGRGLPWINPGLAGVPGLWLSQKEDDASQSISDFLSLITSNGALTWYVDHGGVLRIIPIPTVPTRLLVCTTPAARTIVADVNTLWVRYQATADTSGTTAATFGVTSATNPASIAAHGVMESYQDLSSAGIIGATAAQNAAKAALSAYVRATYAGPFQIRQGQLLTLGGTPVDIGAERGVPGVCQLLLTDGGYGGEVVPGPVTWPIGSYEFDDTAQIATVTPFLSVASNLSSLLAAMFPATPTPVTAAVAG